MITIFNCCIINEYIYLFSIAKIEAIYLYIYIYKTDVANFFADGYYQK